MNLYHDIILDHYRYPRHQGELKHPDGKAKEANASCGDLIEFSIKLKIPDLPAGRSGILKASSSPGVGLDSPGVESPSQVESPRELATVRWRGVGCAISTAAASLLSEKVIKESGSIKEIMELTDQDLVELLGGDISSARIKCAALPLTALKKAIENAKI